jgi:thioesterase domain-containing protein
MISRLQANLNAALPLAALFVHPTLETLAQAIAQSEPLSRGAALPVRQTGNQPPIFFVPTGLGKYHYVFDLAKSIDAKYPIYALPWPPIRGGETQTVEEIAQKMARMIRNIQDRGPYFIAGYSSGGVLAYAIAQYFISIAETISFVGLIDVRLPKYNIKSVLDPKRMLIDAIEAGKAGNFKLKSNPEASGYDIYSLEQLIVKAKDTGCIPKWMDNDTWIEACHYRNALEKYPLPPLPLTIYQFHSIKRSSTILEPLNSTLGWDRVLPMSSIHVIPVPGDHVSMMTDPLNRMRLGASLSETLERDCS